MHASKRSYLSGQLLEVGLAGLVALVAAGHGWSEDGRGQRRRIAGGGGWRAHEGGYGSGARNNREKEGEKRTQKGRRFVGERRGLWRLQMRRGKKRAVGKPEERRPFISELKVCLARTKASISSVDSSTS